MSDEIANTDVITRPKRISRAWKWLRLPLIFVLILLSIYLLLSLDGSDRLWFLLPYALAHVIFFLHHHSAPKWLRIIAGTIDILVSGTLVSMAAGFLTSWLPPTTVDIVLLGPRSDTHWHAFMEGVQSAFPPNANDRRFLTSLEAYADGTTIGTLDLAENARTPRPLVSFIYRDLPDDQDAAKKVIDEIIAKEKVVLITGFVTSTSAGVALRELDAKYPKKSQDWPTVILPMATASSLITEFNPKGERPVLRIVPTNAAQSAKIANDIVSEALPDGQVSGKTNYPSIAIFRDGENNVYSNDLADSFRKTPGMTQMRLVFDGCISSETSGPFAPECLLVYRPDYITYFGMPEFGLTLARQIKILAKYDAEIKMGTNVVPWRPKIIFSDGCVTSDIYSTPDLDEFKGIVGYFPCGKLEASSTDRSNLRSDPTTPNFKMFGHDTIDTIDRIVHAADGEARRQDLAAAVKLIKVQSQDPNSPVPYNFTSNGEVQNLTYHRWVFNGSVWENDEPSR
jgi:hypothetical protein